MRQTERVRGGFILVTHTLNTPTQNTHTLTSEGLDISESNQDAGENIIKAKRGLNRSMSR